ENGDRQDEIRRLRRTRKPNQYRGRDLGDWILNRDYFGVDGDQPLESDKDFRRRFRISKEIFLRIKADLTVQFRFFRQLPDVAGVLGFSTKQKMTAAL
ncbi:hypothetical protein DFS34DRAFT_570282, partial [Phlyctochytrium arcticum]